MKPLLLLTVLLAAMLFTMLPTVSFAWGSPICNPSTGEVLKGNGAAPLTTEDLYSRYLKDHKGSYEMSPGSKCHPPTSTPAPTVTNTPVPTSTPTQTSVPTVTPTPPPGSTATPTSQSTQVPTATPIQPSSPVPEETVVTNVTRTTSSYVDRGPTRDQYCHKEPEIGSTGNWEIRFTGDLLKALTGGGKQVLRSDVCEQDEEVVATPTSAPTLVSTVLVVSTQVATPTPSVAPTEIPTEVPTPLPARPTATPTLIPDPTPVIVVPTALPETGDGTTASD